MKKNILTIIIVLVCLLMCCAGCMSPQKLAVRRLHNHYYLGDYQLDYRFDTLFVWDRGKIVAKHVDTTRCLKHGAFLDSFVVADNL